MESKLLTPLELKVMNLLWSQKQALVKELIASWPEPDQVPKYNTISTIVRILEEKGFVGHEAEGRSHRYFPLISKRKYQKRLIHNVMENVFSGSLTGMVSSLLDSQRVSPEELARLKSLIDESEAQGE
ncbi:MAG: BlaI/MecI/CopY family transcriptional regulator [Bacteroidetes bacterium]|nr:MAG: BlaI/MecI/CopY family transcriptional regulator [Bacteroidota bacterium]